MLATTQTREPIKDFFWQENVFSVPGNTSHFYSYFLASSLTFLKLQTILNP